MKSFIQVAPIYDELMRSVPYRMWTSYYLLLLAHQEVHPKTVLDVCCGTGTMCELLTNEGLELAGFDLSAPMIEAARAKYPEIPFWIMDASSFELNRTFDAAFSFYDSLNNILDPARLQSAFHRVAAHLPEGGSWIFDLNTEYAFQQRMFDQQHLKPNAKLRYKWEGAFDPVTKIIEVHMRFWRGDVEFDEVHVQRAYDLDQVRAMLEEAGFERIQRFHSYTLDHPRATSDRVHFACLKA